MSARASVLLGGPPVTAPGLVLGAPVSFWGGVDPATGTIIMPSHPDFGTSIAGTVLFVPATIGSSGASSVMLELVHNGKAPAALVLNQPDAILIVGLIAARELGLAHPMALRLEADAFAAYAGVSVTVSPDGTVKGNG